MIPDQYRRAHDWLWTREPRSPAQRALLHLARYVMALARDLIEGDISLRAMSLVYTTLLSLVPFLALAFSVLKALGVHDSLEPVLQQMLQSLGDQAAAVTKNIIGFVDNIKVGVLGFVGVITLLYTAVSMISKIEGSFNFIWNIQRTRGVTRRFSEYLTVLLVGPILIFAALGITATVRNSSIVTQLASIEPFGTAILLLTKAAPYVLIVGAFTFLYGFIPNTRVRLKAAATGGLFAGVAWESASAAFATFVSGSHQYSAIYSGFAIVIVLLIWLYLGWLIILFGCRLSFYVQNPAFLKITNDPPPPGSREAEVLALRVILAIAERFTAGAPALTLEQLVQLLGVPLERLERSINVLASAGLIAEVLPERRWLPLRDPASLSVAELWRLVRGRIEDFPAGDVQARRAAAFIQATEQRIAEQASPSLRDWLQSEPAQARVTESGKGGARA
ncbi:MAG: YihY/virulence factor BrkB family protein [Nevskia sp.]|nr:YihY/virulence factor BrkB family protein [Nevskia sp.]